MAFRAYAQDVPSRTRARVWHLGPMPQTVSNLPLQPSQSSGALWLKAMCDALWLTAMCDTLWLTAMCDTLWLTAMCDTLWLMAMCDALWLTAMCDALWLMAMCDTLWLKAMCDALWLTAMCDTLWLMAMCDALWLTAMCDTLWFTTKGLISLHISSLATATALKNGLYEAYTNLPKGNEKKSSTNIPKCTSHVSVGIRTNFLSFTRQVDYSTKTPIQRTHIVHTFTT
ncbi:hypothetical protein M8J77_016127 [Diaphorina citri]|nr:hypothetical protein M8J77_016127 [Diaphorina citri]